MGGNILYGENNFGGDHALKVLPEHNGADVYVRTAGCPGTGSGWKKVRHVPAGDKWHPATDQLRGTEVYGTEGGDGAWSIEFPLFDQFLFSTGDCTKWLIADKDQVMGWYSNGQRTIVSSSLQTDPYDARWYRRQNSLEDPWISLNDHFVAISQGNILYGENNFGGDHALKVLPVHNGADVYVRMA